MKPVILLTHKYTDDQWGAGRIYKVPSNYCRALEKAGFLPVIHAGGDPEDAAQLADAVLFTGGADVETLRYGEEVMFDVHSDHELDETEFPIFKAFFEAGKPIFGICRGMQLINVALGGTLYQHVPGQVSLSAHKEVYASDTHEHPVSSVPGSFISRLFGDELMINSYHHQAVKGLGSGLKAAAVTDEGIVEAVEHETLPIAAVQWHPERMIGEESSSLPDMMPLFRYFAGICEKHSEK